MCCKAGGTEKWGHETSANIGPPNALNRSSGGKASVLISFKVLYFFFFIEWDFGFMLFYPTPRLEAKICNNNWYMVVNFQEEEKENRKEREGKRLKE